MKAKYKLVGIGEILWDLLPAGKQLGGAPTNFAYHVNALGETGIAVSRIGSDDLGKESMDRMQELGMATAFIQTDHRYSTGTVPVQVNAKGEPVFTIAEDVAWDYLEWNASLQLLSTEAQAVCFGSLAQRMKGSRYTIQRFLQSTGDECLKIFDINLRQSHYTAEILVQSMKSAHILKLNHEELPVVIGLLGENADHNDEKTSARYLIDRFSIALVCITRGAQGSVLVTDQDICEHAGYPVNVVDTVGSGDAFTACLAVCYLRSYSLEKTSEASNRLGAWVAGRAGATPSPDDDILGLLD